MGAASSKAARKLPKERPTWAGARAPAPSDPLQPQPRDLILNVRVLEITRDAIDPQFMANLSRLGAVRVDHHMQTVRTVSGLNPTLRYFRRDNRQADSINRGFQSRQQSDAQAASSQPVRNRLLAPALSALLEERKHVTSRQDLEKLATQYAVDVDKLDRLARYVNSPSIDETTRTRVLENDEERITVKVSTMFLSLGHAHISTGNLD
ncbi:hypothetical protein GLOTRDRAFT_35646 [Gloeophyllum trabeum ATCC 11539]|uniref:Uncharacterized protein n=1 Tax=Gloeophyllum trabeum (strain ATCC 11539 / FP-39264 / Madison 617) TaxID=670483 RepID=S7RUM0_GLOTA|nr:uncharacterized protein GLOTRDRAFT_35646 [Gloeophyllum trabeum ATCC 11539]EPQ58430.1 hypothetical protein GLOTRDRAFT_35646 [Gloeophyllum trabeum ATCC 11539]